jgi:hypothetical protein
MEFGSLKLTDNGWTVLRGDKTVQGYLDQELDVVAPFVDEPVQADDLTCDDRLFEILRSKRKELADETGVPPYVIFSDKTLIEMAVFFPNPSTVCWIFMVSVRLNARNSVNCFSILFVCTAGKIKLRNDPKEPAGLYEAARPKAHKC